MRVWLEGGEKLATIFQHRLDDYNKAYSQVFWKGIPVTPEGISPAGGEGIRLCADLAEEMAAFLKGRWKIDFSLYEMDEIEDDLEKGKAFLRYMLEAYDDEMEDVQREIGTTLRNTIKFFQLFSPKVDFLNEVGRDSYIRRPLERLWQMEPLCIFEDMSVSEDAEVDTLLDALETNFTPVIQDVASAVDKVRRVWFARFIASDEDEELVFYEVLERTLTHCIATEARVAAADWILQCLDGDALIVGILEICRRGLECLTQYCGNYKFIAENRSFIENIAGRRS